MEKEKFAAELQALIGGVVFIDEAMSKHTSWRIGGPADIFVTASCIDDIKAVIKYCRMQSLPLFTCGKGTNLLVSDGGIRGVVLHVGDGLSRITVNDDASIYAEAGASLAALSWKAAEHDLIGLEWAVGIPGNVGGAVIMNAGAYGDHVANFVTKVDIVEYNGITAQLSAAEMDFAYRHSAINSNQIVIGALWQLQPGDGKAAQAKMRELLQKRASRQPLEYPSCGSVFRNPDGDYAGRLVEAAGCMGLSCGGAQVSLKHGNFIVNLGNATAKDVLTLIEQVQQCVKEKFDVLLKPEVKIVGEM